MYVIVDIRRHSLPLSRNPAAVFFEHRDQIQGLSHG